ILEGEATVAATAFALGTGQGVFLTSLRVQEHREVRAHGTIAQCLHFLGGGAYDDPVHLADVAAQQAIAHCAADFIDLHVLPPWWRRIKDKRLDGGARVSRGRGEKPGARSRNSRVQE